MPKVSLTNVTNITGNPGSAAANINANFQAISEQVDLLVSRDAESPNTMQNDLDMNSNEILNLGSPTTSQSAARWVDVASVVGLTTAVPALSGNANLFLGTDGTTLSWRGKWPARSSREVAASVTPSNYDYQPEDIRRYGAVGDGATDDSAAFTRASILERDIVLDAGDYYINTVVTIYSNMYGKGATGSGTAGRTTITLGPSGRLVVGDWHLKWDGIVFRSATNSATFITCAQSYFTLTRYRFERAGSPTGQIGIHFDCTSNSVYFATLENFKHKVDYPVWIDGTSSYVFNANKIGGSTRDYWQDFQSAITIDNVAAVDANQFAGYFETGTNFITLADAQFRQNRMSYVLDGVTRDLNVTPNITGSNTWERHDGGTFTKTGAGNFTFEQQFIGIPVTRVRATQSTAQAMANAAATVVTYDSETFDTVSELVNGTGIFTAKNPGYYRVTGGARSASVAWDAGERWEARIYKNGVEYASGNWDRADAAATNQRSSYVSAIVYMNGTTDTLDLRIIHNQGASVNLDTAPTANFIEIERLSNG